MSLNSSKLTENKKQFQLHLTYPTVVSHLVMVVGLCTDDPKDF